MPWEGGYQAGKNRKVETQTQSKYNNNDTGTGGVRTSEGLASSAPWPLQPTQSSPGTPSGVQPSPAPSLHDRCATCCTGGDPAVFIHQRPEPNSHQFTINVLSCHSAAQCHPLAIHWVRSMLPVPDLMCSVGVSQVPGADPPPLQRWRWLPPGRCPLCRSHSSAEAGNHHGRNWNAPSGW